MNKTKLRRKPATQIKSKQKPSYRSRRTTTKGREITPVCQDTCSNRSLHLNKNSRLKKTRKVVSKIYQKNIIDVMKCISGSTEALAGDKCSLPLQVGCKLSRTLSEQSVIYVGTFSPCFDMPRKDSIVDLTKSDTTLNSWGSTYNLENYDISGDNIVDELHLKDHPVASNASIFTIFPPKPQSLFSSPSEELCICQKENPDYITHKRNLSSTDMSCYTGECRSKRMAVGKSKLEKNETASSDCVWKLKKSYPLTNGLCLHNSNLKDIFAENMDVDSGLNIMNIVDDLQKEFNISRSQELCRMNEGKEMEVSPICDSSIMNM